MSSQWPFLLKHKMKQRVYKQQWQVHEPDWHKQYKNQELIQIGIGYQEYFSLFIDMVETTDHFLQKKNYFCKASYVAINF